MSVVVLKYEEKQKQANEIKCERCYYSYYSLYCYNNNNKKKQKKTSYIIPYQWPGYIEYVQKFLSLCFFYRFICCLVVVLLLLLLSVVYSCNKRKERMTNIIMLIYFILVFFLRKLLTRFIKAFVKVYECVCVHCELMLKTLVIRQFWHLHFIDI